MFNVRQPYKIKKEKQLFPHVTDINGNAYTTVRICNQLWTVENWRSTKYACGTPIPYYTDNTAWSNLSGPGYCWYDNSADQEFRSKYGALYNWHVVDPSNPKKLAPAGWRVPTDADWNALETALGGRNNESGFSALPGSYRNGDGGFRYQSDDGGWWSATELDASFAWYCYLGFTTETLQWKDYANKRFGFSIRLMKDI